MAATALTAALAIGTSATAVAEREWDIGQYEQCISDGYGMGFSPAQWDEYEQACCIASGGDWLPAPAEGNKCYAPPAEAENVPRQPAATTTPPVMQNPTGKPVNPLVPVPRGPSSGTVG
jgi:hypothetical protein